MTLARQLIKPICLFGIMLVLLSSMVMGQDRASGDALIVEPEVVVELLFDSGSETEGPAVAFDNTVFFVAFDRSNLAAGGTIWRFDPATAGASVFRSGWGLASGAAIDANGDLLIAEIAAGGGRCVSGIDLDTGDSSVVAGSYRGQPFNGVNDLVFDEQGRLYFTEYDVKMPQEVLHHRGNGIYRLDPDGSVSRIIDDAGLPNGIVVSPDQKTLYISTNQFDILGTNAVLSYDLSPDGDVTFRSVLAEYRSGSGQLTDGMAVDVDGNIYVAIASWDGETGVAVYDPFGERLAFLLESVVY